MGTPSRCLEEKELDQAIELTFPASDPVATGASTGTERLGSDPMRKPPVITKEQIEDAAAETEECPECRGAATLKNQECPRCGGHGRVAVAGNLTGTRVRS